MTSLINKKKTSTQNRNSNTIEKASVGGSSVDFVLIWCLFFLLFYFMFWTWSYVGTTTLKNYIHYCITKKNQINPIKNMLHCNNEYRYFVCSEWGYLFQSESMFLVMLSSCVVISEAPSSSENLLCLWEVQMLSSADFVSCIWSCQEVFVMVVMSLQFTDTLITLCKWR